MSSIIEEWRAIAAFHTEALSKAEAKIQELTVAAVPAATPEPALLTMTAIHALVSKMAADDSKKDKAAWNKLIKRRLVENVQSILFECYPSLRSKSDNPDGYKAARELGGRDSAKWQQFGLRVIHYLKVKGSFGIGTEYESDFEDTAGGCDEVTWNAACYLLEHPEWTPAPAVAPAAVFSDLAAWGAPEPV
jgi:hypothetical protein